MQFKDPIGAHRSAGIPVMGRAWRDERFADDDVSGIIYQDCVFDAVQFERLAFEQTMFVQCRFRDCTFRDAKLVHTRWVGCEGTGLSVTGGEVQDIASATPGSARSTSVSKRCESCSPSPASSGSHSAAPGRAKTR